jgi:hypothetical protein
MGWYTGGTKELLMPDAPTQSRMWLIAAILPACNGELNVVGMLEGLHASSKL